MPFISDGIASQASLMDTSSGVLAHMSTSANMPKYYQQKIRTKNETAPI